MRQLRDALAMSRSHTCSSHLRRRISNEEIQSNRCGNCLYARGIRDSRVGAELRCASVDVRGTALRDCGTGYPAGRKIVTSQWLNGMGLPDNGTAHPAVASKDIHSGLLLSKHGPTQQLLRRVRRHSRLDALARR